MDSTEEGRDMNRLTAVRSFGNPGYTPARAVRVMGTGWYLATMQNTEHDARTDYHGLADGEYTELVTGIEARSRKNSRLNHLNRLTPYTGQVWQFQGGRYRVTKYFTSQAGAEAESVRQHAGEQADRDETIRHRDAYRAMTPETAEARAKITGIGIAFLGNAAYWRMEAERSHKNADDVQAYLDKPAPAAWDHSITQIA